MMNDTQDLAKYIDHTNLKADCSINDIKILCEEAKKYGFATVCVAPYFLDDCRKLLDGSQVGLCTVIGFPFGYQHIAAKVEECKKAIASGADELDVVVNIAAIISNDWETVKTELDMISTTIKMKNKVMKLIFETSYLNDFQIIELCRMCLEFRIDYAKTSTGFSSQGATLENVALMKENLEGKVKIKASGGIKTKEMALKFIAAGANRIGTSSGVNIVSES